MKVLPGSHFFDKSIYFYTRRSFYVHLALIVVILLFSYFLKGRSSWTTKMTIVESSVRVDVVAMPKYTVQELRAFQEQATDFNLEHGIDEELAKIDDPEELSFRIKKKKQNFMSMLKKIGDKKIAKKKKKKKKKDDTLSRNMRNELKNLVLAGNKLSKGTALTGSQIAGEMTIFDTYISGLPAWVRPNWKLPSYLMQDELKCRVRVFLNSTGKLIKATIYEGSGNPEYDQRALKAVRASNPFPIIPGEIGSRASRGEIVLGFPL